VFRFTFEKYRCFGSLSKFIDKRSFLLDKLYVERDINIL